MKQQIDSLICTVGTSLVGHWKKGSQEWKNERVGTIVVNSYEKLLQALKSMQKTSDGEEGENNFCDPESDRRFGAEINSIESLIKKKYTTELKKIIFLVSETYDGRNTGRILKNFYEKKGIKCEVMEIKGLQHEDEKRFRKVGLRELVLKMVDSVHKLKEGGFNPGINATGGYKAQIAFAVLIGQVMKVPVYYRFESFPEIIVLPPLPINYDFEIWGKYYDLLDRAYGDTTVEVDDIPFDEEHSLEILFDVEGRSAILSAVGIVFFEALKKFVWEQVELPPASERSIEERLKNIRLEKSGHIDEKFVHFCRRIIEKFNFTEGIRTVYSNPDLPKKTRFYKPPEGEVNEIRFVYSDGTKSVKGIIYTTAKTPQQQIRVIQELNQCYN